MSRLGQRFITLSGFCIALAFTILPVSADDAARNCQSDAMLVFDASGSMGTTDYTLKVPRIARLKQSLGIVVPEVAPIRRLGLIVYGEGAYDECNSIQLHMRPTANASDELLSIVETINPRGRTPLTDSVQQAANVLDYRNEPAVVVLVTDGEETCGGDPCALGTLLEKTGKDITVHVIGYREAGADYFRARCIADATGGRYFAVSTEDQLIDALRQTLGCPFLTESKPRRFASSRVFPQCAPATASSRSCRRPQ